MFINRIVKSAIIIVAVLVACFIFNYDLLISNNKKNSIGLAAFFQRKEVNIALAEEKSKKNLPNYPFKVGEKLKYGIYSAGLKVGELTITYLGSQELNGTLMDAIVLESKAPGFRDVEKIYGDIESFSPVRIERKIGLFGEDINIIEEYNQKENELIVTRKAKKTTVKKITSKDKISNVILLLYHFRYNKDKYKIGDRIKFNLPTKQLEMLIEKSTKIKVPKGSFMALFVRSLPSHFKVWFNDDKNSIPLRIQGNIGFGSTHLAFIDYEKSTNVF